MSAVSATTEVGSYPCYAGGQQVKNPALKREIKFLRNSDGMRVEFGVPSTDGDGIWARVHNTIPLKDILVDDFTEQQKAEQMQRSRSGQMDLSAILKATPFSKKSPEDQDAIAKAIHDPKRWKVEIKWKIGDDGFIATLERVDEVAGLLLEPQ